MSIAKPRKHEIRAAASETQAVPREVDTLSVGATVSKKELKKLPYHEFTLTYEAPGLKGPVVLEGTTGNLLMFWDEGNEGVLSLHGARVTLPAGVPAADAQGLASRAFQQAYQAEGLQAFLPKAAVAGEDVQPALASEASAVVDVTASFTRKGGGDPRCDDQPTTVLQPSLHRLDEFTKILIAEAEFYGVDAKKIAGWREEASQVDKSADLGHEDELDQANLQSEILEEISDLGHRVEDEDDTILIYRQRPAIPWENAWDAVRMDLRHRVENVASLLQGAGIPVSHVSQVDRDDAWGWQFGLGVQGPKSGGHYPAWIEFCLCDGRADDGREGDYYVRCGLEAWGGIPLGQYAPGNYTEEIYARTTEALLDRIRGFSPAEMAAFVESEVPKACFPLRPSAATVRGQVLETIQDCVTEEGAACWREHGYAKRRMNSINDSVGWALEKAKEIPETGPAAKLVEALREMHTDPEASLWDDRGRTEARIRAIDAIARRALVFAETRGWLADGKEDLSGDEQAMVQRYSGLVADDSDHRASTGKSLSGAAAELDDLRRTFKAATGSDIETFRRTWPIIGRAFQGND